jgi:hypothetical protein
MNCGMAGWSRCPSLGQIRAWAKAWCSRHWTSLSSVAPLDSRDGPYVFRGPAFGRDFVGERFGLSAAGELAVLGGYLYFLAFFDEEGDADFQTGFQFGCLGDAAAR